MQMKPVCMAILVSALPGAGSLVTASTLADPTRPANTALYSTYSGHMAVNSRWVLNSTLVAADRRVAVINGQHVSEGESVDNATVLQIRKMDVLIQSGGKRITLRLLPDIVKTLPGSME